jgi:acetyl esterase
MLDQIAAVEGHGVRELDVATSRTFLEGTTQLAAPPPELAGVEDRTFPGPAGAVPVRIYRPVTPADGEAQPALVWFHGGGWVLGSINSADPVCRELAAASGAVVVSVGYRLAPEHPHPAGFEDCYAALEWVHADAAALGIDPARLAIGGDSAGGNLAAVVALAARDRQGPATRLQLLVYPVTDARLSYPSVQQNGTGYLLTADTLRWFVELYLGAHHEHGDPQDPYVSPIYAGDLRGLPPAFVITAEFDPLRDEGEAYCLRLQQAGVDASYCRYDGMIHLFFGMTELVDRARLAIEEAAAALAAALAGASPARPRAHDPANKEALT